MENIEKELTLEEQVIALQNKVAELENARFEAARRIGNLENQVMTIRSRVEQEINSHVTSINRTTDYLYQVQNEFDKIVNFSNYLIERFGTDLIDMEIAEKCKIDLN